MMLDFFGIMRQRAFLRNIRDKTRKGADIPIVPLGSARRGGAVGWPAWALPRDAVRRGPV